jgi:hypothetical protein
MRALHTSQMAAKLAAAGAVDRSCDNKKKQRRWV